MYTRFKNHRKINFAFVIMVSGLLLVTDFIQGQPKGDKVQWIRPGDNNSSPIWGIHNGIVVGLWPADIEKTGQNSEGGPRGLLRIGYEFNGVIYLINFIAIEPVVNGDMEFSEVSPSRADGKWGKLFWAADTSGNKFTPYANTHGIISHPDPHHPEIEQLSLYIIMEKFFNGAHPYLKLNIRSDRQGELGIETFNQKGSAKIERCALTATMGNYSRLRLLYLKDKVIDSRKLFVGYDDIGFAEKQPYAYDQMLRGKNGGYFVCAESDENFNELASWPQQPAYLSNWAWRYRPFYKLTQYWRVDANKFDPSLLVRVNGRAKYWSGDNPDKSKYMNIPGGPAFENFELRENYHAGQKSYFGLSMRPAKDLIKEWLK